MRSALIVISTILVLTSPLVYIKSILNGKTKPHRTTRFVLMVITVLSTASLWHAHNAAFWLALASAWQGVAVFALSIKRGVGGWEKLDLVCLGIALIGIVLWQTSGQAIVGLYASIIADLVGGVPFMVKTFHQPQTENWQFYAMDTVAATLSLLALTTFTAYSTSYPIYLILFNGLAVIMILWRRQLVHGSIRL